MASLSFDLPLPLSLSTFISNASILPTQLEKTDSTDELNIISYKQCDNQSSNSLKKIRGLICDKDAIIASSLGYTCEYTNEDDLSFIDLTKVACYPALEGTLLRLFSYKNKWFLSTHRKLDAFTSRWGGNQTFGDIASKALEALNISYDIWTTTLDPSHVYFILVRNTVSTRVVSEPPSIPTVFHVATLLNNQVFDLEMSIGLPKQDRLSFQTMAQLQSYVYDCNPVFQQGVIFFDMESGTPTKIVNVNYQNKARVRNNEPDLSFRYLELWRDMTSPLYQTFVELYPEFGNKSQKYVNVSFKIAKHLHNLYFSKFVKKDKKIMKTEEWLIVKYVHEWYWAERQTRKVTLDVMHKMMLSDCVLRSYYKIIKQFIP